MEVFEGRYFQPWVGENYGKNDRVLILGESIYRCPNTKPERCVELIHNNATGVERHKFYTNIYKACNGADAPTSPEAKTQFWANVSYINFVDDIVEGGSRQSPGKESFSKARDDWQTVLDHFKPDHIVVLGKRLWNNLPAGNEADAKLPNEINSNHPVRFYHHCSGKAKVTYVHHPSARFTTAAWHKVLSAFFNSSGK